MSQLLFDFKDFATPKVISKKITTEFNKAANVTPVNVEVSPKTRRDSGVSFREIFAMFADNQTVTLRVKQSGDIYKVLINNKLLPIKNQDNHAKAIGEICSAMDKGRSAFQKKLAKTKITLPPSVKSTIVSKQQALDNKKTALLEAIDAVQNELNAVNAEIDDFQNKIDTGNKTISDAQVIMPDSQHNTTSVAELTREATDQLNQHADQPSGQDNTTQNGTQNTTQPATPEDMKEDAKEFLQRMNLATFNDLHSEEEAKQALEKVKEIKKKYPDLENEGALQKLKSFLSKVDSFDADLLERKIEITKTQIQNITEMLEQINIDNFDGDDHDLLQSCKAMIEEASKKVLEFENNFDKNITEIKRHKMNDELNKIQDITVPFRKRLEPLLEIEKFIKRWREEILTADKNWGQERFTRAIKELKEFKVFKDVKDLSVLYDDEISKMIEQLENMQNQFLDNASISEIVGSRMPQLNLVLKHYKKMDADFINEFHNLTLDKNNTIPFGVTKEEIAIVRKKTIQPEDKEIVRELIEKDVDNVNHETFLKIQDDLNAQNFKYGRDNINYAARILSNYKTYLSHYISADANINELTEKEKIAVIEAINPFMDEGHEISKAFLDSMASFMGEAYLDKIGAELTKSEKLAIFSVIGQPINSTLHFLNQNNIQDPMFDKYNEIVISALNKIPKYVGEVLRGECFEDENQFTSRLAELQADTCDVSSFLSTTIDEKCADTYSAWKRRTVYSIKIHISAKTAVYVDPIVTIHTLGQLVLMKGTKLKYISHKFKGKTKKKCEIWLEEI